MPYENFAAVMLPVRAERTESRWPCQVAPAIPSALFVAAATTPATRVPWPYVSTAAAMPALQVLVAWQVLAVLSGTHAAPVQSAETRLPAKVEKRGVLPDQKSGWSKSTPESTTAIVIAGSPVVMAHACPALTRSRFVWLGRRGSFGVSGTTGGVCSAPTSFGAAMSTPPVLRSLASTCISPSAVCRTRNRI